MFFKRWFLILYNLFTRNSANAKRSFVYVAIGDSTVQGLGATTPQRSYAGIIFEVIKSTYKNAQFHNLGVMDSRVKDVLQYQLKKAISLSPDLITISIGANDIRRRTSSIEFERDLHTLLLTLKKETLAEIVINNIPDMSLTPAVPKKLKTLSRIQVNRFNQRITRQAKKVGVILVDLYALSQIYGKNYPEMISQDGFHPSDFGYAIWANTVVIHLQHLLFPSRKNDFQKIMP